MTIEQTIDIPENRKVHFDVVLPRTVPSGSTKVTLAFPSPNSQETVKPQLPVKPEEESAYAAGDDALAAYYASLPKTGPTIAELKEEAARKYAERFKDGYDALQKYCGCLVDVYTEDGVVCQKQWRAEWDREWDK
ncbi:MAG: hypothetical protein LBF77_08940 [Spirochaetaceae bacterium]|jgi:hypothetical protein|nr:hypothetical protein [Spirochaetaceae bacterium]